MTPAQEAKAYAEQNGFTIVPNGRRYTVMHPEAPAFERGGYPAVLSEMRFIVNTLNYAKCTAPADDVGVDFGVDIPVMMIHAATGEALDKLAKLVDVPNEVAQAVHASEASQTPVLTNGAATLENGDIVVIRDGAPVSVVDPATGIAYMPKLTLQGNVERDMPFESFSEAAQARIRKRAADMRQSQHKPYHAIIRFSSKVPGFDEAFSRPFLTRAEALKYIRQMRGSYPHDIEFVNIAYMG